VVVEVLSVVVVLSSVVLIVVFTGSGGVESESGQANLSHLYVPMSLVLPSQLAHPVPKKG